MHSNFQHVREDPNIKNMDLFGSRPTISEPFGRASDLNEVYIESN